jgi:hypothetical protein
MDIFALIRFFADPLRHFAIAFCAGALVFLAAGIAFTALSRTTVWRGLSPSSRTRVKYGTLIILLLLSVSVGLLSHYGLDYWHTWYTTPLGPALTIIK